MKTYLYKLLPLFFLLMGFGYVHAQTFEIRTTENDMGYLAVQMRETSGTGTPTTATNIVDITFVVRYPSGSVDLELLCTSNAYSIIDGLGGEQTFGAYDYHYWNGNIATPIHPPHDWIQNEWEEIAVFYATGPGTTSLFEIAPDKWATKSLNWNQEGMDYTPSINGNISYLVPTTVYNYVWTGSGGGLPTQQNQYKWEYTNNWRGRCPGDAPPEDTYPYIGQLDSYVYIPGGLTYYPQSTSGDDDWGWEADKMQIGPGAVVSVPDLSSSSTQPYMHITQNLIIDGTLNLLPKGHATVDGTTTINTHNGLVLQSDETGTGSLLTGGTITYGSLGTAKVETFMSNSAGSGNFDIHLIGPTVDAENYTGGGSGAFLLDFILEGVNTYAYAYQDGWFNVYDAYREVRTGSGIGISTIDNNDHTLEMTGELITGTVYSPVLIYSPGGNNYELISNPYPSGIDFDLLSGENSTLFSNGYWMWDPNSGNYLERSGGVGAQSNIQVGQAVFVQASSTGPVTFNNTIRKHCTDPFRAPSQNILHILAQGGRSGYADVAIIRFDTNATSGYDPGLDAEYWESQLPDATSLCSLTDNSLELAINALPMDEWPLNIDLNIPLRFTCGYDTTYLLTFDGMESFSPQIELWLEDLKTGTDWISLNNIPNYAFTASPEDDNDRFVIHFMGPTGVSEAIPTDIVIYSYNHEAIINNPTTENINRVIIYNLGGAMIMDYAPADDRLIRIPILQPNGYYIVRVITDKHVMSKKIFIN